jgi:hypothetical protein
MRSALELNIGAARWEGVVMQGETGIDHRARTGAPPLSDYLAAIRTHLSTDLIDAGSFRAIDEVAGWLPAAVAPHFGFECRLADPDAKADFLLATSVASRSREIMAGRHPGIPAPAVLTAGAGWSRARDFFQEWADPASPLHDGADHVALEFDLAGPAGRGTVPNLFFAPQHPDWISGRAGDPGELAMARGVVARGIEVLSGGPPDPETAETLHRCFAALPDHAWVFHIGVMSARDPSPIRLMFSGLTPGEFLAFLRTVNWPGESDALEQLLADYAALTDDIIFAIDLFGRLGPKIGLECYLRDRPGGGMSDRWPAFFDHLVQHGLCLPVKRDALLAFPGVSYEATDPDHWPASLTQATRLLGNRSVPVLSRYLHHVKIVFERGQAAEAKAYPGVALQWATRGAS